ncbi:MAG: heparan-alpha-glucosaminide N-acetyltransferase domain-containing protein [Myxococcota bacterium]
MPSGEEQRALPVPTSRRVLFIDMLRLLASFQMIHGHTFDALLAEELRSGPAFVGWTWVRGLTSVAFLFAAGLSFSLSTLDRFDKHRHDRGTQVRRLRRIGWLVLLGYLLHAPLPVLFGADPGAALREFAIVDVLQCIGVSILLLQLLVWTLPSRRAVGLTAIGLGVVFIGAAPTLSTIDPSGVGRPSLNYLTASGGSIFPLFPWAGMVFLGAGLGELVLQGRRVPWVLAARLAGIGVAMASIAFVPNLAPSTHHLLLKLAAVTTVAAMFALLSQLVRRLPRPLAVLSGESLMLYVFHLMVIYAGGIGLRFVIGPTLSVSAAALVSAILMAVTVAVALGWHRVKAWSKDRGQRPSRSYGRSSPATTYSAPPK